MITVEKCQDYLKNSGFTKERTEEIRNFLYAFCEEIVNNNVENNSKHLNDQYGKTQTEKHK